MTWYARPIIAIDCGTAGALPAAGDDPAVTDIGAVCFDANGTAEGIYYRTADAVDPEDIVALLSEWTPVAHNVSHDYLCVRKLCGPYADKIPPPDRWIDTVSLAFLAFPDLISNPTECSLESLVGKLSVLPQITTPHQSVRDAEMCGRVYWALCRLFSHRLPDTFEGVLAASARVRGLVHHAIDRAHRAAVEAKRPLDHCIQKYGKEAVVDIVRALIDAVSGLPPYSAATRAAIVKTLRYLLDSLESAVYNGTYG